MGCPHCSLRYFLLRLPELKYEVDKFIVQFLILLYLFCKTLEQFTLQDKGMSKCSLIQSSRIKCKTVRNHRITIEAISITIQVIIYVLGLLIITCVFYSCLIN